MECLRSSDRNGRADLYEQYQHEYVPRMYGTSLNNFLEEVTSAATQMVKMRIYVANNKKRDARSHRDCSAISDEHKDRNECAGLIARRQLTTREHLKNIVVLYCIYRLIVT